MGESVMAGVALEAQEAIKGMVGGVIGSVLTGIDLKPASLPGDHTGIFYVAVGPNNVGFFSIKAHFAFQDGTHYALMCPRISLGKLKKVRELLVTD